MTLPKCDSCGRFHRAEKGSAWRMVYSGVPLQPDHEKTRCKQCVQRYGSFRPQAGVRPAASCGVVGEAG